MKKVIKWTLYILILLGALGYGYWEMTKPLPVSLLELKPTDIAISFRETGTVAASGFRDIYAETALTILDVRVKEEDVVQPGDMLVLLDTEPLEQQLVSLEAQITGVDASRDSALRSLKDRVAQQKTALDETGRQLAVAQSELSRVQQLFTTGGATQAELDAADNTVSSLEGVIRQMKQELSQLQAQTVQKDSETDRVYQSQADVLRTQADVIRSEMEKAEVLSPLSGVVTRVFAHPGQPASPMSPLLQIMEDGTRRIDVFVRAEDLSEIKTGMIVEAVRENRAEDIRFDATVRRIASSAEERISSLGLVEKRVKVALEADGLDAIVEGTDVDVVFTTHRESGVLTVPKTAVFKQGDKDAVWLSRDGVAFMQFITTGLEGELDLVVTDGLSSGDLLVKDPNVEGLTEGKRLEDMSR